MYQIKKRPHVHPQTVDAMRNIKIKLGVIDAELAETVGVCRSYINLMLNHRVPMPKKYFVPLDDFLYARQQRADKLAKYKATQKAL